MLAAKIKTHALKRSRKCAALAAELLETIAQGTEEEAPTLGAPGDGGAANEELIALREAHSSLGEEAMFWKMQAQQLERENRRLTAMTKGIKQTKRELLRQIAELDATLQKERRERAAMEVALSEAYSQTLRELVASQDAAMEKAAATTSYVASGGSGQSARPLGKAMKGLFR